MPTALKSDFVVNEAPGLDWGNGVAFGLNRYTHRVYNVLEYDAKGNGTTDDTEAIQDAIDAAINAGGGRVYFPAGSYLLDTVNGPVDNVSWHLAVTGDNIHLDFSPGAKLVSTKDAIPIWVEGAGKPAGMASWTTHRYQNLTVYTMTDCDAGDLSITLDTAAEAANFEEGDYIYIRTGQINPNASSEPQAELNKVVSADADTGVITLAWPLHHDYRQEYYISGTSGETSTSETDNAAPFGVANATASTIHNFRMTGLDLDFTGNERAYLCRQTDRERVEHCKATGKSGGFGGGDVHDVIYRDVSFELLGTGVYKRGIGHGTGSTDLVYEDFHLFSRSRVVFLHIHEGLANVVAKNFTIQSATSATSGETSISVRGRSRDIQILDGYVINSGPGAAVFVSEESGAGGFIDGITVGGSGFTSAFHIRGPNWSFGPRNSALAGDVRFNCSQFENAAVSDNKRTVSAWVYDDQTNPFIFTLPVNAMVTNAYVDVTEAFNSDGTDLLTVGYDTDTDAIVQSVDVSTTGKKAITLGDLVGRYNDTARSIEAYYVNGGSEPTTGKALVVIEWQYVELRI